MTTPDDDDWWVGFRLYDDVADAQSEIESSDDWPSTSAAQALTEELSARRQARPADDPL